MCGRNLQADEICGRNLQADGIYGRNLRIDGRTRLRSCGEAAVLANDRTRYTYAGMLYLCTDGGVSYLRRGAAVPAYACGVSYRRARGAVQVREREMGKMRRRKTQRRSENSVR